MFGGTAFSPDGGLIYYVCYDRNDPHGALYRIPVLGGPPTRLIGDFDSMFSLSPDGREVAFYRKDASRKEESIVVAALDGSNERALVTRSQSDTIFMGMPAWSPDGSLIAFAASEAGSLRRRREAHLFLSPMSEAVRSSNCRPNALSKSAR